MESLTAANDCINLLMRKVNRKIYIINYNKSDHGKRKRRDYAKAYADTKKHHKEYEKSEQGLNRAKKYRNSEKGKKLIQKYHTSYTTYIKSANKRKKEFNLTQSYFSNLKTFPCFYCGQYEENIGIDRVVNEIDYIMGNCVSACKMCNYMKGKYNIHDFKNKCKQIINRET